MAAAIAAAVFAARASQHTKRSADTADMVFNSVERPYLVLEIVKSGVVKDGKNTTFGPVKYRFVNLGRTPAIITRMKFDYRRSEGLPSPIDPVAVEGNQIPYGHAIAAGLRSQKFETGAALPIISMVAQLQAGDKVGPDLFLIGFVKYRSLSGAEYATGFCFFHDEKIGFDIAGPRLKPSEEDRYNYDRRLS